MRYVFIVNPHAGGKRGSEFIRKAAEAYFGGIDYGIYETRYPGHATEIVKEELKRGERIRFYGVGGDGTLLEIIRGAACTPMAEVGIFPLGSGNDYVRTYGEIEDFLDFERQMRGFSRPVDLIKTEGGYAVNLCSVGLDAKVAYNMVHYKSIPGISGPLAYDLALVCCLLSRLGENITATITTENGPIQIKGTYLFALAASGQWYGGGYHGAPQAVTNDGLLDFVLIQKPALYRIPGLIGIYKNGRHLTSPKFTDILTCVRGSSIHIESAVPMVCNRDGECDKVKRETFTVVPAALKFILPEGMYYGERRIETSRLLLRGWKEEDFEDFYALMSDAEVMPKAGAKPLESLSEGKDKFAAFMDDGGCYAIVLKETGRVIGSVKYQEDNRRFGVFSRTVGYELNKDYWANGYMTEALAAMVKNAFEREGLDILGIGHFEGNEKSRRVIEKCGFRFEGKLRSAFMRYDGQVFDDMAYSITKEEYFSEVKQKIEPYL